MYVKAFEQMLGSTINEQPLHVRWVWMAMLMMADVTGTVDRTAESIARAANVPLDLTQDALVRLGAPDPASRSREEDGRRLVPLREGYGWRIVTYEKYRSIRSEEDRRESNRLAQQRCRAKKAAAREEIPSAAHAPAPASGDEEDEGRDVVRSFDAVIGRKRGASKIAA